MSANGRSAVERRSGSESSAGGDGHLEAIAGTLGRTGWAADLYDGAWRLRWVSDQLRALLGAHDTQDLGVGRHLLEAHQASPWWHSVTPESRRRWLERNGSYLAHGTPGGVESLRRLAAKEDVELFGDVSPAAPPPAWMSTVDFVQGELPPVGVHCLAVRHEVDGHIAGTSFVYGATIPATVLALLSRGDTDMFNRMAARAEPARHATAVLFVDLCSSGTLSRSLPTSTYFAFVQVLMTSIDRAIADHRGVVGKHLGDGATAFFLADEHGSDSSAARAAIEAARAITEAARSAADALADQGVPISREEVAIRAGLHWGASIFMGQVITGGRLEVTALGDEVNECARIEQAAAAQEVLASKALVERLSDRDAATLGIDQNDFRYQTLAESALADEKVRRDAGGVAVTDLARRASGFPESSAGAEEHGGGSE